MGARLLVVGIDAATWTVIRPNIELLPNFKKLLKEGKAKPLVLDQKPWSASCWTSMFTGKTEEEHNHTDFVKGGIVQKREDIKAEFVWDTLARDGYTIKALNVPFIVPPFNFNVNFSPPGLGIPTTFEEMNQEIKAVTEKCLKILQNFYIDLLIACYVSLDKLQHFYWGDPVVLRYYKKIDCSLGKLLPYAEKAIIVSDHGFCDFGGAPCQTLPKVTKDGTRLKGDHHPEAILITKGVKGDIKNIRDVFHCILNEVRATGNAKMLDNKLTP